MNDFATPKPQRSLATGDAVVLLGHGSRASGAGEVLLWAAQRLRSRLGCSVEPASLQFNRPTLSESCAKLAETGVNRIIVAPYFLFSGNHMKLDIPEVIEQLSLTNPGVELLLAQPLGSDERLVEAVESRIAEALAGAAPVRVSQEQAADRGTAAFSAESPQIHPIEAESFEIIDDLLQPADSGEPRYQVTRRVVHASGDPALADELLFSPNWLEAARSALAPGSSIICDVRMVEAGVTPSAAKAGLSAWCSVDSRETVELAALESITRGAAGIRRATAMIEGSLVVIGNAPTALFECLRLAGEGQARPALIVGVPVGFVGARESKDALAASGLEHISIPGTRGGSNIAAAIANALIRLGGRD